MRPFSLCLHRGVVFLLLLLTACQMNGVDQDAAAPGGAAQEISAESDTPLQEQPLPPPVEEILFEEPGPPPVISPNRTKQPVVTPPSEEKKPQIAIIIDDMGYHRSIGDQLLDLELDITFSFLPHAPHTAEQEEKAYQLGRDILVHLPMQPKDAAWDPGPGALYTRLSDQEIDSATLQMLEGVPHATGANNHMGSHFTEDPRAMRQVLAVLKDKGFFFIDSYTSAASVGLSEALALEIPSARRHVFLDNVHDPASICDQIKQLVALAKKQGWAIGIGHPNQATLTALTDCAALLQGVDVVAVHHLLNGRQP